MASFIDTLRFPGDLFKQVAAVFQNQLAKVNFGMIKQPMRLL